MTDVARSAGRSESWFFVLAAAVTPVLIAWAVASPMACRDVDVAVPELAVSPGEEITDTATVSRQECDLPTAAIVDADDLAGRVALTELEAGEPVGASQVGSQAVAVGGNTSADGTSVALAKGTQLVLSESFVAGDAVDLLFSPTNQPSEAPAPPVPAIVLANTDELIVVSVEDVDTFTRFAGSSLVVVRRARTG